METDMAVIVKACTIIHNMTVEHRRGTYRATRRVNRAVAEDASIPNAVRMNPAPEGRTESAQFWHEHLRGIEGIEEHMGLKKALAEHIWDNGGLQYNATSQVDVEEERTENLSGVGNEN
jgi:hypothetical protein